MKLCNMFKKYHRFLLPLPNPLSEEDDWKIAADAEVFDVANNLKCWFKVFYENKLLLKPTSNLFLISLPCH